MSTRNAQIAALILQQSIEEGEFNCCLTHYNASDGTGQITVDANNQKTINYLLHQVFYHPSNIRSAIAHAHQTRKGVIRITLEGSCLRVTIVQSERKVFCTTRSTQPHSV